MRVLDAALPRLRAGALVALVAALAAGCASRTHKAPVEQRQPAAAVQAPAAPVATPAPAATVPVPTGAENAGKPGYYTVKPGDTMIRIGLEAGQNWRDIARWNGLGNANVIEVGQVLRVVPPAVEGVAVQPVATAGPVESRPLDAAAANAAAQPAPAAAAAPLDPEEDLGWAWPANGPVLATFDDSKTKGLVIGGQAGDPVLASAAGRVVYAGSGLRGYGNLVIVKHNATFLTAYAHNQALLVKEDEIVRRGQKIAEMGSSDADRVQLHFEIRRQGRPIDPARLLPPR
jgi:lipoprotein NlpD